ncbi:MAG: flagellar type III secretion system pore protein FliP [Bacillota bacterium]
MRNKYLLTILLLLSLVIFIQSPTFAAPEFEIPNLRLEIGEEGNQPQDLAVSLRILLILTVLTLAPAILILLTSFTRIVVVLSLLRRALATQQMPPNQVIIALAIVLTVYIMAPVWTQVNQDALQPYLNEEVNEEQAFDNAVTPMRDFMFSYTREKDVALFVNLSEMPRPDDQQDIPLYVLVPAFVISELKTAFQIGFIIYLPFVVIDMIVASTLMSMGMMMLPPVMISLPFKILLFVLVDGWHLVIKSLIETF